MKFSDLDIRAIGNTVQLVGGIWAGDGKAYLLYFPEFGEEFAPVTVEMTADDWKTLLRQSDLVETEVLEKAEDGTLVKAVVRKCQRAIDQQVTWNVFRRDNFKCRYCADATAPLTVDHLVLWEEGGPTIEENLAAACRKCNKIRGRTPYPKWLHHPYYREVSANLTQDEKVANVNVLTVLDRIPRVVNIKSRK